MTSAFLCPDGKEIIIRPLCESDSIAELTDLLHRAYNSQMDPGLIFFAAHQSEEDTKERAREGECFVGTLDGKLVATITLYHGKHLQCEWYKRDGVWFFGQFAVDPSLRKAGLGTALISMCEQYARERGASEMSLDTAETATKLIAYYNKRGYRPVDHVQWDVVDYRSVILSNRLV
jgi:GNAT superfamily N-acetyltransferase